MIKILLATLLTFFTINFTQSSNAQPADEYKVGIGDILEASILQPEKLSTTLTVSPDGMISFPYVGNVGVKDLTLSQIQNNLEAKLADGYMKYPLVSVSLKESHSRRFFVYGDVSRPGGYPLDGDITLLKAISIAGGFSKNSSGAKVKVLRPKNGGSGYQTIEPDIKGVLEGSSDADIGILPEDMVMVTISPARFYVYGEVNHPGVFPMEENTTVLKAIAVADGFTKYGSASRVKILRPKSDGTGYENIKVNIKAIMNGSPQEDMLLKTEDTVVVSEGVF